MPSGYIPPNRFSAGDVVTLASTYTPEGQTFKVPEGTTGVIRVKFWSELRTMWVYDIEDEKKKTHCAIPQNILALVSAGNGSDTEGSESSRSSFEVAQTS
ncbi:hypothetical protein MD484_g3253, partial [Candolleomyces efflorescens]